MIVKLTLRAVRDAVPKHNAWFLWDDEVQGFGVKVTPSGTKVYILQYRTGGRTAVTKRYTIGKHGSPWTPELARREALRLKGIVAQGGDPAREKQADRASMSVAELCELYRREGCRMKKPSTIKSDQSRIDRHIIPLLGQKRVKDLRPADIERFLSDVAAGLTSRDEKVGYRKRSQVRGGRGAATRTVGLLGGILSFAVKREIIEKNPVRGVQRFPDRTVERFLTPDEMKRLGAVLDEAEKDGVPVAGINAIRLLLLTGRRKSEILTLKWEYIDLERGFMKLPETKTGEKTVLLGPPALVLLRSITRVPGNPYVCPGEKEKSHLIGFDHIWERVRKRAGLEDVRPHDLRHSYASIALSQGLSLRLIQTLLGHKDYKSTLRYTHLADDVHRAAVENVAMSIHAAVSAIAHAEQKPQRPMRFRHGRLRQMSSLIS